MVCLECKLEEGVKCPALSCHSLSCSPKTYLSLSLELSCPLAAHNASLALSWDSAGVKVESGLTPSFFYDMCWDLMLKGKHFYPLYLLLSPSK